MIFNLLGGSYEQRYLAANSQRTINWYPVISSKTEENKSQIALYKTAGLTLQTTLPGRYARGFITARTHNYTKCFAVVDNVLYEITIDGTYNTIGTMSNMEVASTSVKMLCNLQDEVGIFGQSASYVYNMGTGALTQITDEFFPNYISHADYVDQYAVVCSEGAVFESLTTSFLNWSGSQTYSPTFKAAPVVALAILREQIFNFTTETIEVFINDGTSPYSRLPRTSILVGIKAKDSLATFKDGFVFLGKAVNGETAVFFFDGYNNPQAISDTSVTWQINQALSLEASYGYIQQTKDGDYWYYLTIPTLDHTMIYSFKTGTWFWRQSTNPWLDSDGQRQQGIFRGKFFTSFNGKNLFLDAYSGKVFQEDYTINTEDSLFIRRERRSQEIWNEDKNISHTKVVLDCSVGSSTGYLELSWSDNGGYTFNDSYLLSLGSSGDYSKRILLHNLGTSRRRTYKIVLTDDVDCMLQNAYIETIPGSY